MDTLFEGETYDSAPILSWMEAFDRWAQMKSNSQIIAGLQKKGLKPYFLEHQEMMLRSPGVSLVDGGEHLHIPNVLDHKVIWGPNGVVAVNQWGMVIAGGHSL